VALKVLRGFVHSSDIHVLNFLSGDGTSALNSAERDRARWKIWALLVQVQTLPYPTTLRRCSSVGYHSINFELSIYLITPAFFRLARMILFYSVALIPAPLSKYPSMLVTTMAKIRVPESQRAVISFKVSVPSYKLLLHNTGAEQKASPDPTSLLHGTSLPVFLWSRCPCLGIQSLANHV
jgi:hypothetical protein